MSDKNNKKPVATKKFGLVVASIWENQSTGGKTFHSVTLERLYKPKDSDQWKSTASFDRDDLPKLAQVVDDAYRWFYTERDSQKAAE